MLQLYFAKHFVPLHRRLCLTLVKIAKLKLRVYMEAQTAVHFRCIVLTRKNIALCTR